jgi:hypothetical protein
MQAQYGVKLNDFGRLDVFNGAPLSQVFMDAYCGSPFSIYNKVKKEKIEIKLPPDFMPQIARTAMLWNIERAIKKKLFKLTLFAPSGGFYHGVINVVPGIQNNEDGARLLYLIGAAPEMNNEIEACDQLFKMGEVGKKYLDMLVKNKPSLKERVENKKKTRKKTVEKNRFHKVEIALKDMPENRLLKLMEQKGSDFRLSLRWLNRAFEVYSPDMIAAFMAVQMSGSWGVEPYIYKKAVVRSKRIHKRYIKFLTENCTDKNMRFMIGLAPFSPELTEWLLRNGGAYVKSSLAEPVNQRYRDGFEVGGIVWLLMRNGEKDIFKKIISGKNLQTAGNALAAYAKFTGKFEDVVNRAVMLYGTKPGYRGKNELLEGMSGVLYYKTDLSEQNRDLLVKNFTNFIGTMNNLKIVSRIHSNNSKALLRYFRRQGKSFPDKLFYQVPAENLSPLCRIEALKMALKKLEIWNPRMSELQRKVFQYAETDPACAELLFDFCIRRREDMLGMGGAEMLPFLLKYIDESNLSLAVKMCDLVNRMGGYGRSIAPELIVRLKKSKSWIFKMMLVRTLAEVGYREAIPEITQLASGDQPQLKKMAEQALKLLKPINAEVVDEISCRKY